ncbi:bifunctional DNA primase/polymerase [Roseovarius tibetensis]|uniref:bifunctional DNA primase/polymerase n=1 Tax=Roseovarius tibetensis TaxID=2685897 RepID=UPI003D7FA538
MTALVKSGLPDDFRAEMARLHRVGFPLLPLGGGDDGKKPLLRGWADKSLTLAQVFGPMHRSGVAMYGIRLDGLAVVDCDTDDPVLVAELEARFGPSPVHVQTPRGRHLYYLANGTPPNLRGERLPVDIKTGSRAYVAGPHSMRPDGGIYAPGRGMLGVDALNPLRIPSSEPVAAVSRPAPILTGTRHVELVKFAIQRVAHAASPEELTANLRQLRDDWCETPRTMPESELAEIARWAWQCRLENRLYAGRMSAFSLHRRPLDLLRGKPAQEGALALYVRLVDQHGHTPGKTFPLCHKAMKKAGLTSLSKARFLAARRALEEVGLLKLAGRHHVGKKMQTFALAMPMPADAPENVQYPSFGEAGGAGGRG